MCRRKWSVKLLWSQKPSSSAIVAIASLPSCRRLRMNEGLEGRSECPATGHGQPRPTPDVCDLPCKTTAKISVIGGGTFRAERSCSGWLFPRTAKLRSPSWPRHPLCQHLSRGLLCVGFARARCSSYGFFWWRFRKRAVGSVVLHGAADGPDGCTPGRQGDSICTNAAMVDFIAEAAALDIG